MYTVFKNSKLKNDTYMYRVYVFKDNTMYSIYSNKMNMVDMQMFMVLKHELDVIISNEYYVDRS